jgi:4-amino-4-deoxy-L-arabinose transferase-like glycosyltransferase
VVAAVAIGSLLALPWFLLANERTNGEFFRVFFWHHNVERALGDSPTLATHPWWYYGPRFAIDFLPWTPLLIGGVFCFVRKRAWRTDVEATLGLIWLLVMIGMLSLARFKRADYLLPAFTGAALASGCAFERWYEQLGVHGRRLLIATFATIVIATLVGWFWFHSRIEPRQEAVREQSAFAAHIRQHAPAPNSVLLFRVESHLLAYHLRRPIHTLVEWGELNDRLARPGVHWFVTREEFVAECRQNVAARGIEVVARSREFSRATPLRPLVLVRTVD